MFSWFSCCTFLNLKKRTNVKNSCTCALSITASLSSSFEYDSCAVSPVRNFNEIFSPRTRVWIEKNGKNTHEFLDEIKIMRVLYGRHRYLLDKFVKIATADIEFNIR